jgi:uncharacterized protein YgfB (UPF0149 family)
MKGDCRLGIEEEEEEEEEEEDADEVVGWIIKFLWRDAPMPKRAS